MKSKRKGCYTAENADGAGGQGLALAIRVISAISGQHLLRLLRFVVPVALDLTVRADRRGENLTVTVGPLAAELPGHRVAFACGREPPHRTRTGGTLRLPLRAVSPTLTGIKPAPLPGCRCRV
jgi:hypothetical protein